MSYVSEGLIAVRKDGKWGFCNRSGKIKIKPRWNRVDSFRDGRAKVFDGERWGIIDKSGKVIY